MLTREETDQSEQTSAPSRQPRLRRYMARRARQLWRMLLYLAIGLVFAAGALEVWRGASLIGLPDVGDPFDVAAFWAFRVPADQDAFVLLREAQARLSPMPHLPIAAQRLGLGVGWSKAAPELRSWAEANRAVLETFRRATDRPDGIVHPSVDRHDAHYYLNLGPLVCLALLEAARLEERGEMSEAWNWYRAVLRMKVHVMRRGSHFQRLVADGTCSALQPRIATWAADRRTSVPLLRRALDDVKAGEPRSEWDSFSLKIDYLDLMNELDTVGGWVQHGNEEDQHIRVGGEVLPPNLAANVYAVRRYLSNEPERSRRVFRLAFANWLAHAEERDPHFRKPAVRATIGQSKQTSTLFFYPVAAHGPVAARRLPPEKLAESLIGTLDARLLLFNLPWSSIPTSERRAHRAMVVLLAGELYRRERGSPAASDEALVGPYLDHLPDDGSDELDDGKVPAIRDDKAMEAGKSG